MARAGAGIETLEIALCDMDKMIQFNRDKQLGKAHKSNGKQYIYNLRICALILNNRGTVERSRRVEKKTLNSTGDGLNFMFRGLFTGCFQELSYLAPDGEFCRKRVKDNAIDGSNRL